MSEPSSAAAPIIHFQLPNARAGLPYAHSIAASSTDVLVCALRIPEGLGMQAGTSPAAISGTPAVPGEYEIGIDYRLADDGANEARQAVVKLIVTPDPRTLWKNLPTDPQAPYWKPDHFCKAVCGARMHAVAASTRGRSHAHVGSFRDDAVDIGLVADTGWYFAVVADGAGSARYSREGASLICRTAGARMAAALGAAAGHALDAAAQACQDACADLAAQPEGEARQQLRQLASSVVGNAAYYAAKAIMDECTAREADLHPAPSFKDYASTALIAIGKRYPFGTLCAAYWVGDGAVAAYSQRDGVILLGEGDSGDYAGETRFLDSAAVTPEALLARTRVAIVPHLTALILMSDGVSDPKFETDARLRRACDWDALWTELEADAGLASVSPGSTGTDARPGKEQQLLAWLDFWSQGNHDDRSIAIIQ